MQVATIIPIARGIPFDVLTYYCPLFLTPGTLVQVPFGKQTIAGIVLACDPLADAKALIKQATFSLKKIKAVLGELPYFTNAIAALQATATETLAPVGTIAGSVIPQFLFEYMQSDKISDVLTSVAHTQTTFSERVIAASSSDRTDEYKRMIRTAFAAKQSVYFVAPTIRSLTQWHSRLEKGIQKHVIIIHSKTTKKNMRSAFALLKSSPRPLLVLVTPGFLLVPRADVGQIIVEDESSSLYKTNDRFGLDTRIFIKHFCQHAGIGLTWGDVIPRIETLARLHSEHLPRAYVPEKLHIVAIDHYRTVLPSEVMDLIRHAQKKKLRVFMYTNRKGIAPISRCSDCGTIVSCPTCELPIVLRNKVHSDGSTERHFVCTHCADTLPPTHTCTYCDSWNISPLHIGTESLRDEVASLVGAEHVIAVDDDLTPDSAAIETLIKDIHQKKFVIVVGTTKVLPYLKEMQYTLVPYMDRILSVPALSTTETVLRLIMECNEKSSEGVIVCTRNPQFPMLKQLASQKIGAIISDELTARKELGYPPYGLIIKISITAPISHRISLAESVGTFFAHTDISALPPRRISVGSMKILMVWIIKAPLSYIEDEGTSITEFMNSLHFPYKIEQNPERF